MPPLRRSAAMAGLLAWVLAWATLLAGCQGPPPRREIPAWQRASRLTVGMSRNQVNKAMGWMVHRNRTYSTPQGPYEDWVYNPDTPRERVHLRFHRGRLISIGVNQKARSRKE